MGLLFDEPGCETFKYKSRFIIYFLLRNDRVVYVGQSKRGIIRPLSYWEKDFDTVKVLYCTEKDLNALEDKYIAKYQPEYNKTISTATHYSMMRARNLIREQINNPDFHITHLKKIMKILDIQAVTMDYKLHIKREDFEKVLGYAKRSSEGI